MVDERRKRIPQPWLWVLAGAALVGVFVFVFVVAPSLLIPHPYKGLTAAEELQARNDVRTTLVQALAGLAVAGGLIVTYRTYQQNRAEQDRTYERELYAQAVEQLGHEKAPVRLGALYSLERLAQDQPERRQVIVNVICAYLRMPFSATTPESALHPEDEPAWQQEKQVRLTAQRILAEHLGDNRAKDKRSTDPLSPRFWPDVRLDLAGATLIDFNLNNGVMTDANFNRATFSGFAGFDGATFDGLPSFDGTTFSDGAGFIGTTFSGNAWFDGATFCGDAWFAAATFSGSARFKGTTFQGEAGFDLSTFNDKRGYTTFESATFTGLTHFDRATFCSITGFRGVTINAMASMSFERSRVLRPKAKNTWPTGWRLGTDGTGGYTVVRANDDASQPVPEDGSGDASRSQE
jgi:Pentapeptide repeats (9 copies)